MRRTLFLLGLLLVPIAFRGTAGAVKAGLEADEASRDIAPGSSAAAVK